MSRYCQHGPTDEELLRLHRIAKHTLFSEVREFNDVGPKDWTDNKTPRRTSVEEVASELSLSSIDLRSSLDLPWSD